MSAAAEAGEDGIFAAADQVTAMSTSSSFCSSSWQGSVSDVDLDDDMSVVFVRNRSRSRSCRVRRPVRLTDLPTDALENLAQYLDTEDLCRLAGTCRTLHAVVESVARERARVLAGPLFEAMPRHAKHSSWTAEYALLERQFRLPTVAAGAYQSLFAKEGDVYAFGAGNLGQIAVPERVDRHTPHKAFACPPGRSVVCTSAGSAHSAFVLDDGRAFVFGDGRYHQLGLGDMSVHVEPKVVNTGGHAITSVTCGACHTLFLTKEGRVLLCGHFNGFIVRIPRLLDHAALNRVKVRQVSAGLVHSVLLTENGSVFTWGSNNHAQLGYGTLTDTPAPQKVNALARHNIVSVSAGFVHTACINQEGQVFTWGCGVRGRLGHGTECTEYVPRLIESLDGERAASVTAGDELTVIVGETGSLFLTGASPTSNKGDVVTFCVFPRRLQLPPGAGRCTGVALGAAHLLVSTTHGVLSLGRNSRGQAGQAASIGIVTSLTSVPKLFDNTTPRQTRPRIERHCDASGVLSSSWV